MVVLIESFSWKILPKIENYKIEIDERNFYDQPINDSIKQYNEVRKVSRKVTEKYLATGCLLDFAYFEKKYALIL